MSACASWPPPWRYEYSWVPSVSADWQTVAATTPCETDDSIGWVASALPGTHINHNRHYTPAAVQSTESHRIGACVMEMQRILRRDVTKFACEFDNVWTSNVFSRFEIRRIFSCTVVEFEPQVYTIGTTCLHPPATGTTKLNKCALPNSLKGPKIILDMADHQVSKDGPFRILGKAPTYLLSDFFAITFLYFLSLTS